MESLRFESEGVENNTLSFTIYPLTDGITPRNYSFQAASRYLGCLEALKARIKRVVEPFIGNYIWQRDSFQLETSASLPPWCEGLSEGALYLWGHMHYGETVEEEWFLVGLLLAVTVAMPDVVVSIWDNDGEFLLIEAAYALPKWLKPETSRNRVWLRNGEIHILRRRHEAEEGLDIEPALEILKAESNTRAKDSIQKCIADRIGTFPSDTSTTQHWAKCYVPVRVAQVLEQRPQFISSAVECFLQRDSSAMKALSCLEYFQPEAFVMTMVKFHRCSYAQLRQTEFSPPKNYPLLDSMHPNFKAAELGMKITLSMELLCSKHLSRKAQSGSTEISDDLSAALTGPVSREEFMERHVLFPEDDDSWLQSGEAELEEELQKRAAEQGSSRKECPEGYDPSDLVHSFGSFVHNISSHEGAELPPGVELNPTRFMDELKAVMGDDFAKEFSHLNLAESVDEGSDFLSESDSTEKLGTVSHSPESEEEREPDSDDDSEFEHVYDVALRSELHQTKMQQSFIHKPVPSSSSGAEGQLKEVDLDVNLVENLLESYSQQQGRPGPVGNLASLLELHLPRNEDTTQAPKETAQTGASK